MPAAEVAKRSSIHDKVQSYINTILHYDIHDVDLCTEQREVGSSSPALASILRARNDQDVILVDAIVISIATRSTAARGTFVAKRRGVVTAVAIASVPVAEVPVD
jgi:hypothetical protein